MPAELLAGFGPETLFGKVVHNGFVVFKLPCRELVLIGSIGNAEMRVHARYLNV